MNRADIEEWMAHPNAALNRMTIADFKALCYLALRNLKAELSVPQDALVQGVTEKPKYKFPQVFCSQCGNGFGPGNEGFSSCKQHRRAKA